MILHTVKTSPLQTFALADCLNYLAKDDALLLIEDGVIASYIQLDHLPLLLTLNNEGRLWVLQEDLKARAVVNNIAIACNYKGFVELTIKYKNHLAW
ncbi:MAG: sulfurtransferase complex subunit TusB [Psychromonas sp.]|nr:sulfurtransferase complex subunit TusB [Psychromonas sp.]